MATSCASLAIAAVVFSSPSSQKNGSIVGTTKASFLGRRRLRVSKFTAPTGTRSVSTICVVADPERPLWFPGSTPPQWLDGRWKICSGEMLFSGELSKRGTTEFTMTITATTTKYITTRHAAKAPNIRLVPETS